jgi:hypothetical protein
MGELDVRATSIEATMESHCIAGPRMVLPHSPRLAR